MSTMTEELTPRQLAARKAHETRRRNAEAAAAQTAEQVARTVEEMPESCEPFVGAHVRCSGLPGPFQVTAIHDDHVELYGGDWNREGHRQFRAVTADRLRPMTWAEIKRAQADR